MRTQTAIIRVQARKPESKPKPKLSGALLAVHIDGQRVEAHVGDNLLQVALANGIYIPALCVHPALPSDYDALHFDLDEVSADVAHVQTTHCVEASGCRLCLVEVAIQNQGEDGNFTGLQKACSFTVTADMRVVTRSPLIRQARQGALAKLLEHHPHVCLTCPQRDGCSRTLCSYGHSLETRCCSIFSHCELRRVADYVGISMDTPAYRPERSVSLPVVKGEPLYDRDYNLCIDCRRCLVACNTVRGVGCLEVKNTDGRTWVGPIADTLIESGCMFCNACVEVCPTGALLDRTMTPAQHSKAEAPCTMACPAGIDVPRYVQLVGLGKFSEANAVVREKLPFPGILGRACYSPCESACRRGHLDDPLSIRSLKRIAADCDNGLWRKGSRSAPPSGHQVAVIGAGLAGLTVAWYLAKKGHAVTVFDAMPAAGGMVRYGIPAYRLPRAVIDGEIEEVAQLGVEFHFDTRIENLDVLFGQGYEAIFIGIGAQTGTRLDIPGVDLPNVVDGVRYLRDVALGRDVRPEGQVVVIGGGDVACDAARTALRLTDSEIHLMYRRTQAEMSAHPTEMTACLNEGVHARFQSIPLGIQPGDGASTDILKVILAGTQPSQPDAFGHCHLEKVPGSEFITGADLVITAVGQQVEQIVGFGVQYDEKGRIRVREDSLLTSRPGVFAGGDAVLGPASLIDAVAQGRKAAAAMDAFLGGDGDIEETLFDEDWQTDPHIGREEGFNQRSRLAPAMLKQTQRGWDEVELCYKVTDAKAEGLRCLKCNLATQIGEAILPPESWQLLAHDVVQATTTEAGVYQLFDANKQLLAIKGVSNLREGLQEVLESSAMVLYFIAEPAHFYSQRENQLIQAYSEQYGSLPPGIGDDALDDLF